MSANKNAIDVLMNHARNNVTRKRFPCPAGCGRHVTEQDVNTHLDQCLGSAANDTAAGPPKKGDISGIDGNTEGNSNVSNQSTRVAIGSSTKRRRTNPPSSSLKTPPGTNAHNAFSHMMKRSASVFSDEHVIRHRFHLHNVEGFVTWSAEVDADKNNGDNNPKKDSDTPKNNANTNSPTSSTSSIETQWSAAVTITPKKMQSIIVDPGKQQASNDTNNKGLELTISSSLPCIQVDNRQRLIRTHSRLSVSHLKSCLQKSIRRRAPLPAVRVAMELADKAWGDLIRRLPIIVLEDSTLHPDFGLLVWLMVAESKGFFPCMPLLKRVLQIVFEVASCPRQDVFSRNDCTRNSDEHNLPSSLSLVSPTAQLFPNERASNCASINACEVFIRSMLLRAQYGGMKCDVQMLHSFAVKWLKRFHQTGVPISIAAIAPDSSLQLWLDVPRILHEKARAKSEELITSSIVRPGGLIKLLPNDVCAAGIDFHCSSVVDHLLSQHGLYASLCQRLAQLNNDENEVADRDWILGQVKRLIWDYSSGINHRRSLETEEKKKDDPFSRVVWADVLKSPFNDYTKKFVRDRLS